VSSDKKDEDVEIEDLMVALADDPKARLVYNLLSNFHARHEAFWERAKSQSIASSGLQYHLSKLSRDSMKAIFGRKFELIDGTPNQAKRVVDVFVKHATRDDDNANGTSGDEKKKKSSKKKDGDTPNKANRAALALAADGESWQSRARRLIPMIENPSWLVDPFDYNKLASLIANPSNDRQVDKEQLVDRSSYDLPPDGGVPLPKVTQLSPYYPPLFICLFLD
jgi:hypothetical protein